MECPECTERTDVYDSRLIPSGEVRRRRKCQACGFRFATIEIVSLDFPLGKVGRPKSNKPKVARAPKPRVAPSPKPRSRRSDDWDIDDVIDDIGSYINIHRERNYD